MMHPYPYERKVWFLEETCSEAVLLVVYIHIYVCIDVYINIIMIIYDERRSDILFKYIDII